MTSPITVDETAEGICAALARAEAAFDKRGWIEMPKADRDRYLKRALIAKPLIASAIREAEDAALERAAEHFNKQAPSVAAFVDGIGPLGEKLVGLFETSIPDDIRSLKSTKETGHE